MTTTHCSDCAVRVLRDAFEQASHAHRTAERDLQETREFQARLRRQDRKDLDEDIAAMTQTVAERWTRRQQTWAAYYAATSNTTGKTTP